MADQTPQNNNTNWQYFLQQLEKVQKLSNRVNRAQIRMNYTDNEISEIKEAVGLDQGQKQKNVITNEVPSTLSVSQKKRYEEIGKQFVQGAGKQFARIKAAIKLKDKMKTKKDVFVENAKKVKQASKKQIKTGGFWLKIMAIVAILGMVGLLLKDKISTMLPDLGDEVGGFGDKVYAFFERLVSGMVQYSTNMLGGTLGGIIQYVCTNLIPNTISTFFNATLPTAMVASTLAVMSLFSDSAEEQARALLSQGQNHGDSVANQAESQYQQLSARQYQQQMLRQQFAETNLANKDMADVLFMLNNYAQWRMQQSNSNESTVFKAIDDALDVNGVEIDLKSNDGFDMTSMLVELGNLMQQNQNASIEQRRRIVAAHLRNAGINLDQATLNQRLSDSNIAAITKTATEMMGDERYVALQNRLAELSAAERQRRQSNTPPNDNNNGGVANNPIIRQGIINVGQVLGRHFVENASKFLGKLEQFLNGDATNGRLLAGINTYFADLSNAGVAFIGGALDELRQVFLNTYRTRLPNIQVNRTNNTNTNVQTPTVAIDGGNILIMNVQIDDVISKQLSTLDTLNATEVAIQGQITKGNESLTKINQQLASLANVGVAPNVSQDVAEAKRLAMEANSLSVGNTESITRIQGILNNMNQGGSGGGVPAPATL